MQGTPFQAVDSSLAAERDPCGLYVHIPFCETKCGYCDFYSVALKGRDPAPLVDRVMHELETRLRAAGRKIHTIFCGGGTPTLLPIGPLQRLLDALTRVRAVHPVGEFTVEANPATVDDEKAALLAAAGVTRVSMGAQSFHPAELATLERIHQPQDVPRSVRVLRRSGIPQLNLDLIFGIPGQTMRTWQESLHRAIELEPDHLACYGLTYEPGTRFTALRAQGKLQPCDEGLETEMYLCAIDTLEDAGFEQYEISNFARPGCRCRHNLIYWRNHDYIGVGPSAAGCLRGRRYKNVADISAYIRRMDAEGSAEAESETLDPPRRMVEMVMMQLRLRDGLSVSAFRQRFGMDPRSLFRDPLQRWQSHGIVRVDDERIALTRRGLLVADAVIRELAAAIWNGIPADPPPQANAGTALSLPVRSGTS